VSLIKTVIVTKFSVQKVSAQSDLSPLQPNNSKRKIYVKNFFIVIEQMFGFDLGIRITFL